MNAPLIDRLAAALADAAGYLASVRTDRRVLADGTQFALQTLEWADGAKEYAEKANALLEEHDARSDRSAAPAPSRFHAFHWPDHVIGKRESRRIRDDHNALYNSHAELLRALRLCEKPMQIALDSAEWREAHKPDIAQEAPNSPELAFALAAVRNSIAQAEGTT